MSKEGVKILIAASGTGGHVFPALAVAQRLPQYHIEWLGVPDRLETKLVPADYPLHTIMVKGFQGKFGLGTIKTACALFKGILQVRKLLKENDFRLVFTTGGYISAPAILAAYSLGLPVILHESNALPGKVTRLMSRFCTKVALGFGIASKYLPNAKTVYLGTPVRSQFYTAQPLDLGIPNDIPVIVVVGGSQGAVALNRLIENSATPWLEAGACVIHVTGDKDFSENSDLNHPLYIRLPFYENMAALFQRANLIISRAGAATLNEITITQTPSILIPYPYAAEDHQYFNAQVLSSAGAALLFRQEKLTPAFLSFEVLNLLQSPKRLQTMQFNAASLSVINSADLLVDLINQNLK